MQSIKVFASLLWALNVQAKHVWRYNMTVTSAWGEMGKTLVLPNGAHALLP